MKKILSLVILFLLVACAQTITSAPTITSISSVTPVSTVILTETATTLPTLNSQASFTSETISELNAQGYVFDLDNNLIEKVDGKTFIVGRLEANNLHITDYTTGESFTLDVENIGFHHQESNDLYQNILNAKDSKDPNIIWIFNSKYGWFRQIKDGETVTDANAFKDGRILLSELVDNAQIDALFPPDTIAPDFFVNVQTDLGYGIPYSYTSIYFSPGTRNWDSYYFTEYGLTITKENFPSHFWRSYSLKTPAGKTMDVRVQVIMNHDGKKKTIEHFVFAAGSAPKGDDMENLYFPLLPPIDGDYQFNEQGDIYHGAKVRADFFSLLSELSFYFGHDLTGAEFLPDSDVILNSTDFVKIDVGTGLPSPLNHSQLLYMFGTATKNKFGGTGKLLKPPLEIQQILLIPLWARNVPITGPRQ